MDISRIWPEWQVKQLIGEGAFGKVYDISRDNFGIVEHRAMKVISIPVSQYEYNKTLSDGMDEASVSTYYRSMVEEFAREISLLSKLRGTPNIVVYDDYKVVEHEDSFGWDIYIMMELLTPLSKVIRNKSFSQKEVIKLGTDICDALTACHSKKILHRDIKIDNIFVSEDGIYKLGDFGIARKAEQTLGAYTKTGTESYMAPEVYKGEPYGRRADIYSLGMVMYRLLNNNRDPFMPTYPQPITVSDKNNAMVRRMKGEVIPLPNNVDDALGQVILKACSYSQDQRYNTAGELKEALNSIVCNTGVDEVTEKTQSIIIDHNATTRCNSYHDGYQASDDTKTQSAFAGVVSTKKDSAIEKDSVKENKSFSKRKKGVIIAAATALVVGIALFFLINNGGKNNQNIAVPDISESVIAADETQNTEDLSPGDNSETTTNATITQTESSKTKPTSAPTVAPTTGNKPDHTASPIVTPTENNKANTTLTPSEYNYRILNDGSIEITGYNGSSNKLSIPDYINGYMVASIGEDAFYRYENITSVVIPNTVSIIKPFSFEYCTSLSSVVIGNSVTSIGEDAFFGCCSLTSIIIPDSVKDIGKYSFADCSSLSKVTIGNSVTSIGLGAFFECYSISNLTIGYSVISIDAEAFRGCSSLSNVIIPSSVNSIGYWAFESCDSLLSVSLPNTVSFIGDEAFGYHADNNYNEIIIAGFTLYGNKGSAAEEYANNNGLAFIEI